MWQGLVVPAIAVIGAAAMGIWLQGRGFTDGTWLFLWVTCGVFIALNFIGLARLTAWSIQSRPASFVAATVVVGVIGALGWNMYVERVVSRATVLQPEPHPAMPPASPIQPSPVVVPPVETQPDVLAPPDASIAKTVFVEQTRLTGGPNGPFTLSIVLWNTGEATSVRITPTTLIDSREYAYLPTDLPEQSAMGANGKLTLTFGPTKDAELNAALRDRRSVLEIRLWVDYDGTRFEWRGRLNPNAPDMDLVFSDWYRWPTP
jgi:hypothetical protein